MIVAAMRIQLQCNYCTQMARAMLHAVAVHAGAFNCQSWHIQTFKSKLDQSLTEAEPEA